jgi:hypothetical protein
MAFSASAAAPGRDIAGQYLVFSSRVLKNLHGLPEFELLVSSLQAKYPDHLGLL